MKNIIRVCGVVMSVVLLLLTCKLLEANQQYEPFNSESIIELNTIDTTTKKDILIEELNGIVDSNNGGMYKEVAGTENISKERNIVWFGSKKPSSHNIVLNNDTIQWLSNNLSGKLIHSNNMGDTPLSGEYAITDNLKTDLDVWAKNNDININYFKGSSTLKRIYMSLLGNPIGNTLMAMYILTLMVFISYFLVKAKERSIKLLSGVSKQGIFTSDIEYLSKNMFIGYLCGIFFMSLYYLLTKNFQNLLLILKMSLVSVLASFVVILLLSMILSVVVIPNVKYIANREIPIKKFECMTTILKLVAIVFAVSVLANTVLSATVAQRMSKEYSSWANVKNTFRLSFSTLDDLYEDKNLEDVKNFISEMQKENSMSISLVVDKSVEMTDELKEAGFDHFVIVDKSWLEFVGVGVNEKKTNGKLVTYAFESMSPSLKKFALEQMPLLINEDVVKTEKLKYYKFIGREMGALAPNTGDMDALMSLKNPLVVVIDNPAKELKVQGFVIPTLSSGNIIFSDKAVLDNSLKNNIMKKYIISVDNIADLALKIAQDFKEQFWSYIMASVTLLATIVFAGLLNAKIWAYKNKRRIYIMMTNGIKYGDIFRESKKKDICIFAIGICIAGFLSYFVQNMSISIIGSVVAVILILYIIGISLSYGFFAKKEFNKAIYRI